MPLMVLETREALTNGDFFSENEVRQENCCVNLKGLMIVGWFFLGCLEFHSLIRGHSLDYFGTALNHKGCL